MVKVKNSSRALTPVYCRDSRRESTLTFGLSKVSQHVNAWQRSRLGGRGEHDRPVLRSYVLSGNAQ